MSGFWQWITTHEAEAIGLLIGIVSLVLGIYFGAKQLRQQRKVLDWELNADESIVGTVAAKNVTSGLSVRYNDLPLIRPRIIVMHIRNTGWQEVTESDFTSADYVEVSVPDAETLAGASVTAVSDPSVYPVGPLDQALVKVELRPRSMKRKSWLKLQLIVDGGGQPTVSANFTGRSRPMRELVATAIKRGWLWVYFAIPVIGVVGIADVSLFAHPVLSWLAVVVMATILSAMLVLRRRIKRAKRGVR